MNAATVCLVALQLDKAEDVGGVVANVGGMVGGMPQDWPIDPIDGGEQREERRQRRKGR